MFILRHLGSAVRTTSWAPQVYGPTVSYHHPLVWYDDCGDAGAADLPDILWRPVVQPYVDFDAESLNHSDQYGILVFEMAQDDLDFLLRSASTDGDGGIVASAVVFMGESPPMKYVADGTREPLWMRSIDRGRRLGLH
jgi:hypothetical protein